MTNILLKLFDLEIRIKQIIKDKFVQNLQGALEKEQKLKTKLQVKQDENNEILVKFQTIGQKINNMEKHNKDLEKIRIERDSLQTILIQMDANYWKDFLSVEHNKLQRDYRNMEQMLLKQLKELEKLREDIGNVYQSKNKIQRQFEQRQVEMDKNFQKQMAFNERLQHVLE